MTKKNSSKPEIDTINNTEAPPILGNKIARIVASEDATKVLIQWDMQTPVLARHLANINAKNLVGYENIGREVLVTFIDNDPTQPVITGIMASLVDDMVQMELAREDKKKTPSVVSDGENVTITADKNITLICGKSSLTLRRDGKIITKGTNILSRATATNKIKGGSVAVN